LPWLSGKQQRWGHSAAGIEALGGPAKVHEWDQATDFKGLPEKKETPRPMLGGAVRRPKVKHG
jgi:hypothetical protein